MDDVVFTTSYTANYRRVLAYVQRRVPADHAREITDEVFVIAWRRRQDIPTEHLPWLLVTARNLVAQSARTAARNEVLDQECAQLLRSAANNEQVSATVIERLTMLEALRSLAPGDREALMLTVWDGLTAREAAAVTGTSVTGFNVRLHRARRRLTRAVDNPGDLIHPPNAAVTDAELRS